MKDGQMDDFDLGKVSFIDIDSWWRKALTYLTTPVLNLILKLVKGKVSETIASVITKVGSELPANIVLEGALEGVVIPLGLTQAPSIGFNQARFDFVCGNTESDKPSTQNYMHFGFS